MAYRFLGGIIRYMRGGYYGLYGGVSVMKTLEEIKKTNRLMILRTAEDGGMGYMQLASSKKPQQAKVVFSWGGGWDHVSVSFSNRCPTWDEMCEVKDMFFYPEEACVQYHPARSEYVNVHPYCLHIWRYQEGIMPTPPSWMVGPKSGQTWGDMRRIGTTALEGR